MLDSSLNGIVQVPSSVTFNTTTIGKVETLLDCFQSIFPNGLATAIIMLERKQAIEGFLDILFVDLQLSHFVIDFFAVVEGIIGNMNSADQFVNTFLGRGIVTNADEGIFSLLGLVDSLGDLVHAEEAIWGDEDSQRTRTVMGIDDREVLANLVITIADIHGAKGNLRKYPCAPSPLTTIFEFNISHASKLGNDLERITILNGGEFLGQSTRGQECASVGAHRCKSTKGLEFFTYLCEGGNHLNIKVQILGVEEAIYHVLSDFHIFHFELLCVCFSWYHIEAKVKI